MHKLKCKNYGEIIHVNRAKNNSWRAYLKGEVQDFLSRIKKNKRLKGKEITELKRWFDKSPKFIKRASVLHADIKLEHILVKNRKLAGIIDASDTSAGDPMLDFADFYIKYPKQEVQHVLEGYGSHDMKKIQYYAALILLRRIAYHPDSQEKRRKKLFQITQIPYQNI